MIPAAIELVGGPRDGDVIEWAAPIPRAMIAMRYEIPREHRSTAPPEQRIAYYVDTGAENAAGRRVYRFSGF